MKYLIAILALTLAGCSNDSKIIDGLEKLQKETQYNLQTCQNQLDFYRSGGSNSESNYSQNNEPEKPAEPEYEEVEYAQINGKGSKCYEREVEACGMTFSECSDGLVYRCMKDVVYKIGIEKKLVQ